MKRKSKNSRNGENSGNGECLKMREAKEKNQRNVNMDIIRCTALFFVIAIHFYLNSGYYQLPVVGKTMYAMTFVRSIFMTCVPLFLMLSGYLMRKKTLTVSYYKHGRKTLAIYVLVSFCCAAYKGVVLKQPMSVLDAVKGTLDFTNARYSWYMEMYFGLFLLIPFLNILWNNLPSEKWKRVLLVTMIVLTSLGSVINVYDFTNLSWWRNPATFEGKFVQLVPNWWSGMYPLTYYFFGCYLSEYKIQMKKSMNLFLIAVILIFSGVYNLWRSKGANSFVRGGWQGYASLFTLLLTVLIFVFLANLNTADMPQLMKRLLKKMSELCLGAYLISYIFDHQIYRFLELSLPAIPMRFAYFVPVVLIVYICSLCASYVIHLIYEGIRKIEDTIIQKRKKGKQEAKEW